jgi:hypothetical protein
MRVAISNRACEQAIGRYKHAAVVIWHTEDRRKNFQCSRALIS